MDKPTSPTGPGQPSPHQATFEASSLVVPRRPDEVGIVLREDEFQILCDGEINQDRAGRDLCLGLLASAVIGLAGLAATIDWDAALHHGRWGPLVWMFVLGMVAAASGGAAIVYQIRYHRSRTNSPYARLKNRLSQNFKNQVP
jgi:hypothetical protein